MRVRVDEPRHHHSMTGVDDLGGLRFHVAARTDSLDDAAFDQHGAILDDSEVAHFGNNTRTRWAGESHQLRAADDGQAHRSGSIGILIPRSRATRAASG